MLKPVLKTYEIEITAANQSITKNFEFDKNIKMVKSVAVLAITRDDLLYYRGSQRVEINKEEVFPEKYMSKMLMSGISTPVDSRYYTLNLNPGNGSLRVVFQDRDDGLTVFAPYIMGLYFQCEMEDAI